MVVKMKKYLQVFSGGFSNLEVDIEKLKEKLLKIMKIKKNRWNYYRLE